MNTNELKRRYTRLGQNIFCIYLSLQSNLYLFIIFISRLQILEFLLYLSTLLFTWVKVAQMAEKNIEACVCIDVFAYCYLLLLPDVFSFATHLYLEIFENYKWHLSQPTSANPKHNRLVAIANRVATN